MKRSSWAFLFFGLTVMISALVWTSSGNKKEEPSQSLEQGKTTPELAVMNTSGEIIRLADYPGKVIILNFWAKGCNACAREMGEMDALYQKYREDDLVILGINMGNKKEFVVNFRKELNLTFPLLLDSLLITTEKYDVVAIPTTFILDKNRQLVDKIVGETTGAALEGKILGLL